MVQQLLLHDRGVGGGHIREAGNLALGLLHVARLKTGEHGMETTRQCHLRQAVWHRRAVLHTAPLQKHAGLMAGRHFKPDRGTKGKIGCGQRFV